MLKEDKGPLQLHDQDPHRPGATFAAKVKACLAEHADADQGKLNTRSQNPGEKYAPNLQLMRAYDHTLQVSCSLSLSYFAVPEDMQMKPLQAGEGRYTVEAASLPGPLVGQGQKRRVCIRAAAGKTRLECPLVQQMPPQLHIRLDQGTVGWPAMFFMFHGLKLEGSFWWDPAHRFHNDIKGALKGAGLWYMVLETTLAFNFRQGPWQKASFFRQTVEVMEKYLDTEFGQDDELFNTFYEPLATDLGMMGPGFGTTEHMEQVKALMASSRTWQKKGLKVKLCRWMSYFDRAEEFLPLWFITVVSLCVIGIKKGWLNHISELPMFAATGAADLEEGGGQALEHPPAAQGAEEQPRTVKDSNAEAERLRKGCFNTLHLALVVLCSLRTRMLCAMTLALVKPSRTAFGHMLVAAKTQSASVMWWATMANEEWLAELLETIKVQQDPAALGRIGFTMLHGESCGEDHQVANKMVLFLRCLLQSRLHSLLALSYSLPCKFAGLLHDTSSVRFATLKTLKAWWVRLQEVEEAATSDKWYQQLLVMLSWPVMQWPRRLLVALSEHDFEEVPSWVESQLQACFRGFLSTKITEDMFHELQRRENASENDSLSRLQRWRVTCQSKLFKENDRPWVQPTSAAYTGATGRPLPKKLFEATGGSCSIPDEELNRFKEWHSTPQAEAFNQVQYAWMAVQRLPRVRDLELAWMSQLMTPGCAVSHKEKGGGIVLHANAYAAVLWRAKQVMIGGVRHFMYDVTGAKPINVIPIISAKGWRTCDLEGVSPEQFAAHAAAHAQPAQPQVTLRATSAAIPLLEHAALSGFRSLTVPFMQKLITQLDIIPKGSGARPRTMEGVLNVLLPHCLPKHTPSELEEIVKHRCKPKAEELETSVLLAGDNAELAADCMEEDDARDAMQEVQKTKAKIAKARAERASSAKVAQAAASQGGTRASGSGAAASIARSVAPLQDGQVAYSLEEARAYLPKVAGCTLSMERTWHHRWRARYPKAGKFPERQTSMCFGGSVPEQSSLLYCIRFTWECHAAATGAACPWVFD